MKTLFGTKIETGRTQMKLTEKTNVKLESLRDNVSKGQKYAQSSTRAKHILGNINDYHKRVVVHTQGFGRSLNVEMIK